MYVNIARYRALQGLITYTHYDTEVDYKYFLQYKKTMIESKLLEALRKGG